MRRITGKICTSKIVLTSIAVASLLGLAAGPAGASVVAACGSPATLIHDVQGNGAASPLVGNTVTIEGVVVGDFQSPGGLGGFFVQEEDADADADVATSEGIFVFDGGSPVNVASGDLVRVSGQVAEFSA
jgi:predicted extracellular nuclease